MFLTNKNPLLWANSDLFYRSTLYPAGILIPPFIKGEVIKGEVIKGGLNISPFMNVNQAIPIRKNSSFFLGVFWLVLSLAWFTFRLFLLFLELLILVLVLVWVIDPEILAWRAHMDFIWGPQSVVNAFESWRASCGYGLYDSTEGLTYTKFYNKYYLDRYLFDYQLPKEIVAFNEKMAALQSEESKSMSAQLQYTAIICGCILMISRSMN